MKNHREELLKGLKEQHQIHGEYIEMVSNHQDDDSLDWIHEVWIEPFEKLGATLEAYGYAPLEGKDSGVHILQFSLSEEMELPALRDIISLAVRDDDSQPSAQYRIYFGTLFIFVPYFS